MIYDADEIPHSRGEKACLCGAACLLALALAAAVVLFCSYVPA